MRPPKRHLTALAFCLLLARLPEAGGGRTQAADHGAYRNGSAGRLCAEDVADRGDRRAHAEQSVVPGRRPGRRAACRCRPARRPRARCWPASTRRSSNRICGRRRPNLDAAQAQLTQSVAAFDRQKTLLAQGFTTRRDYDSRRSGAEGAQGSVDAAQSALHNARKPLLHRTQGGRRGRRHGPPRSRPARWCRRRRPSSPSPRTATATPCSTSGDAGGGVQNASVACVTIALIVRPARSRRRARCAKSRRRSIRLRARSGSRSPFPRRPSAMPLGAAVIGSRQRQHRQKVILLPWQALTSSAGKPAVWIVDPATKAVAHDAASRCWLRLGHVVVIGQRAEGRPKRRHRRRPVA
jgi:hypothetical protein